MRMWYLCVLCVVSVAIVVNVGQAHHCKEEAGSGRGKRQDGKSEKRFT